ncbi:MAG TPA: hypothetical protein VK044_04670 [Virgibacillus sp.]|nr:hypothetical protein [Virgibacillus sp.]
MNKSEREKKVIENYQSDEKIMILIFAQWCINHDLNARQLYEETYPEQMKNQELIDAMEQTVPKEVADVIDDGVVLQVLQLFGNDDLAFMVQNMIEKREAKE